MGKLYQIFFAKYACITDRKKYIHQDLPFKSIRGIICFLIQSQVHDLLSQLISKKIWSSANQRGDLSCLFNHSEKRCIFSLPCFYFKYLYILMIYHLNDAFVYWIIIIPLKFNVKTLWVIDQLFLNSIKILPTSPLCKLLQSVDESHPSSGRFFLLSSMALWNSVFRLTASCFWLLGFHIWCQNKKRESVKEIKQYSWNKPRWKLGMWNQCKFSLSCQSPNRKGGREVDCSVKNAHL